MRKKNKKFDNSYESEPSSYNGSSTSEGIETNSFDEESNVYPKLQQMINPEIHETSNNIADYAKNPLNIKLKICKNAVYIKQESNNNELKSPNNDKTVHSSQETDFEGFSSCEQKILNPSLVLHESQEEYDNEDEVETSGAYDTTETISENDESYEENNCLQKNFETGGSETTTSSLKFKISAKIVPETGATIYEMISIENSSNANDMKLELNNFENNLDSIERSENELSFNGKIKSITDNEINLTKEDENIIDCKKIYQNDVEENTKLERPIEEINCDACETDNVENSFNIIPNNKLDETMHNQNNNHQKYLNEASPDLFANSSDDDDDDDNSDDDDNNAIKITNNVNMTSFLKLDLNETIIGINPIEIIHKKDKELLRKVQHSLSGLPPPPSVTNLQIDLLNTIASNKENIFNYMESLKNFTHFDKDNKNLFKPSHNLEDMKVIDWPYILSVNYHGISYNNSKVSEELEKLNLNVVERYIGAETKSSFQLSPSSEKKRNMRLKQLNKSPGNRLSHLAKRRAVFSSANLQLKSQNLANNSFSGSRQILLNVPKSTNRRKAKIATPKRKTPGGSQKKNSRKTPSSSAKKKLFFRRPFASQPFGPASRESSKRALFQSPPQQKPLPSKPFFKPEIANRVERSKRALFSPEKFDFTSSQPNLYYKSDLLNSSTNNYGSVDNLAKRKRSHDTDPSSIGNYNRNKLFRSDSNNLLTEENLTPRSLKIKSQSFSNDIRGDNFNNKSFLRASSDSTFNASQLTESHKKKLLWAVSSALKKRQISTSHNDFKKFGSVLFKAVKRLFLEYYKKSSSTSETMLRLSNKYVYYVKQGKSVDDIYIMEKNNIDCEKMAAPIKLTGYIGPQDYANLKNYPLTKSTSCAFLSESSMESFNCNQSFGLNRMNSFSSSQNSDLNKCSQDSYLSATATNLINHQLSDNNNSAIHKTLQKSSSKNNLNCLALKENIDGELRKSGQKNFTGKDQQNVSPYLDKVRLSSNVNKQSISLYDLNTMKAKRQLFDC